MNIVTALFAEQFAKQDFQKELEHPTHHHTQEENEQIKEYCLSPPTKEIWDEIYEMVKEWFKNL